VGKSQIEKKRKSAKKKRKQFLHVTGKRGKVVVCKKNKLGKKKALPEKAKDQWGRDQKGKGGKEKHQKTKLPPWCIPGGQP